MSHLGDLLPLVFVRRHALSDNIFLFFIFILKASCCHFVVKNL
jgi:hypothetical protein